MTKTAFQFKKRKDVVKKINRLFDHAIKHILLWNFQISIHL